jgi:hypothetical protein
MLNLDYRRHFANFWRRAKMAGVAIVAAVPDDIAETHKGIVQLFSSTDDQRSVRESGQAIAALDESTKARHLEMQQSIKGVLSGMARTARRCAHSSLSA